MSRRHTRAAVHPRVSAKPGKLPVQAEAQAVRPSVAIFVAVAVGLLVLYTYPYEKQSLPQRLMHAYLVVYAHAVGSVLWILDRSIRVDGNLITGRFSLLIVRNCDAASIIALFLAALAAYPAKHLQRLVGAVAGLALIFFLNVVRIASVYFIGITWPDAAELVHWQVGPIVLLVLVAMGFLAWVSWAERPARLP